MSENEQKSLSGTRGPTDAQPSIDEEFLKAVPKGVYQQLAKTYFWGTIIGIIFGAVLCIGGFIITIMGLTGSIEWVFQAGNFKSKLTNAGPGIFFALLGALILWRYKPKGRGKLKAGPVSSEVVCEWKEDEINIRLPLGKKDSPMPPSQI